MGEPVGKDLYERDFYAWTQDQAARLRSLAGDNRFDVDNVAGEIEDLGASALGAVQSHVENVFVHLLKLTYSPATDSRPHWIDEAFRYQSEIVNQYTASMRQKIDLDRIWRKAVRRAHVSLISHGEAGIEDVPPNPFTLEHILADDFDPNVAEQTLRSALDRPLPRADE